MKTTFGRQFALIAALLLVCMIFTGVSFRFLMLGYLKSEKRETLSADAEAVASLAEAYDSTGELEENWDFRLSLSLFSDVGEAEALVCDENGFVVLCSCDEFNCEHIGRQVDAALITQIDADGLSELLLRAMAVVPGEAVRLIAQLTGVPEEKLLGDPQIGLDGVAQMLEAFWRINGLGNFTQAVRRAAAAVRAGAGRTGSSG